MKYPFHTAAKKQDSHFTYCRVFINGRLCEMNISHRVGVGFIHSDEVGVWVARASNRCMFFAFFLDLVTCISRKVSYSLVYLISLSLRHMSIDWAGEPPVVRNATPVHKTLSPAMTAFGKLSQTLSLSMINCGRLAYKKHRSTMK